MGRRYESSEGGHPPARRPAQQDAPRRAAGARYQWAGPMIPGAASSSRSAGSSQRARALPDLPLHGHRLRHREDVPRTGPEAGSITSSSAHPPVHGAGLARDRSMDRWPTCHWTPRKIPAEALNIMEPERTLGLVFNSDDQPLSGLRLLPVRLRPHRRGPRTGRLADTARQEALTGA